MKAYGILFLGLIALILLSAVIGSGSEFSFAFLGAAGTLIALDYFLIEKHPF